MEALFLAGHPALDFLNTAYAPNGVTVDVIADGAAYAEWLVAAGLLTRERTAALRRTLGAAAFDKAAAEARALRTWVTDWIDRWRRHPHADYGAEMARLNRLLERTRTYPQLRAGKQGMMLGHQVRLDGPDDLVALVVGPLAELIAGADPHLVKQCAGHACTLRFLDGTRAHSRVFCSARACGNRAKVEAFRERQRAGR